MANLFVKGLKKSVQQSKQLPTRMALLGQIARHPKDFVKTLLESDKRAVAAAMKATGKSRAGQTVAAAKKFAKTGAAKDLTVAVGGGAGSVVGGAMGGLPGALAGDNIGAVVTRKGINRAYSIDRARKRLGKNAPKSAVKAKAQRTQKALERLEKRKGANLSDQLGWGIGNSVAQVTPGVPVPLRGGLVAMRTVPQISKNIQKAQRGQLKLRELPGRITKDIAKDNNVKRIIQRGNARERLMRNRVDKMIKYGGFRAYGRDRVVSQFHRPTAVGFRYTASTPRGLQRRGGRRTALQSPARFYSGQGLIRTF